MATLMRVTAVFTIPGPKRATIGLDFETNLAVINADLDQAAQAAYNGWSGTPNLRGAYHSEVLLDHTEAYAYDIVASGQPAPAAPFKRVLVLGPRASAGAPVPGNNAGSPPSPPQVCVVVTHRTAISTRRRRGRVYMPPPPDNEVTTAGLISVTYDGVLTAAYNSWVVGIQNAAVAPQSYTHSVVTLTSEVDKVQAVTERLVRRRIDTQRRRLTRETV